MVEIAGELQEHVRDQGAEARNSGRRTTGICEAMLGSVIRADVEIVETVAHARSGQMMRPDVDSICDVGGQDIKLMCSTTPWL